MALRKASTTISFAGGVSTKMDPKQVPAAKLLDLQNATFTKENALAKRNGYRALGQLVDNASATYANARGFGQRDGELVISTDSASYSYRPSSDTWSSIGDVASVQATTHPIARSGTAQYGPDSAVISGIRLLGWLDSRGGVWCSVIEDATGRVLLQDTQLDSNTNAHKVRCVNTDSTLCVMWVREDLNEVLIAVVNPATPETVPVPSVLLDDIDPNYYAYDAVSMAMPAPTQAYIMWVTSATTFRIGVITSYGTLGSPVSGFPSVATLTIGSGGPILNHAALAVGPDGTMAAVFGCATLQVSFVDSSLNLVRAMASIVDTTTAVRITGAFGESDGLLQNGGQSYCYFDAVVEVGDGLDNTDLHSILRRRLLVGSTTYDSEPEEVLLGHCLASRAFFDGPDPTATVFYGQTYVAVVKAYKLFPYVAVVRLSSSAGFGGSAHTMVAARLLPGESAGALFRPNGSSFLPIPFLPSVTRLNAATEANAREHVIPLLYRIQLANSSGDQFSEQGIKLATLDFDADGAFQSVQFGRNMYMAGACPSAYDGNQWSEATIHCAPDTGYTDLGATIALSSKFTNGGAGAVPSGTYLYAWWYEHVDAQGELHPGPVNKVLVTVTDGPYLVSITIPTYRLTSRDHVRVCVARSVAGATGTDATIELFRITDTSPQNSTGANRYVENSTTADTVTLTDNLTDANLILREPLYTNGGILSNDPEPWAGGAIATGKGRIYWTDPSDPNLVRFSQQRADDTGLEAPNPLSLLVDPFGGSIVGLAVLDDAIVVLKETAIYIFGGPGPLADGGQVTQDSFTPAALLTSDVGCSSATSIAQTPNGIVFQSSKGIFLVGRDRSIRPIGDDVYAYKDQRITRATLLPDRHQVIFLTDAGSTLLWDYERQQWSRYTNHEGLDGAVVGGVYHYLRTDGRVFAETIGTYVDDNRHIPMVIETAWVKMAGYMQAWQKVWHAYFLGKYISSHQLRVQYRIDYQDAYSAPIDINVDANYNPENYGDGNYGDGDYGGTGGATTVYQEKVHLNVRCQAISFKVQDIEPTDTYGAAFELSELMLTGGILGAGFVPGANRQT